MTTNTLYYSSPFFEIYSDDTKSKQHLIMKMNGSVVNTKYLPNTIKTIKKNFPQVLETECFNDNHLPFYKEVKKTEIGHLFEHVLLAYLYEAYKQNGQYDRCISGITSWNWEKEAWGTFHVYVDDIQFNTKIFHQSYQQALILTEKVMTH